MTIHLHLLHARDKLAPVRERVESAFAHGGTTMSALLPSADIDVVIQANAFVMPETGLVGYTPAADAVIAALAAAGLPVAEIHPRQARDCARVTGPRAQLEARAGARLAEMLAGWYVVACASLIRKRVVELIVYSA
jgi:hypothetical protein